MPIVASIALRAVQSGTLRKSLPDPANPQFLRLSDGRTLAWQRYGAPQGRPLFVMHGFPSCRLLASLVHEQAASAGICLIAADRPGFGQSTPAPSRSIRDWAGDIAQLADHLGHQRFGVLGISCGGPYALACAHAMPQRTSWVGLLGGIGPMDVPALRKDQLRPLKVLFGLAKIHPLLASPIFLADAWLFRANPEKAIATLSGLLSEPDRKLLASNAVARTRFTASFIEAYRQGIGGAMCEARLVARPHGFALADIRVPVDVYQGGLDGHVPPVMGRHIAERLPAGRLHFYPDEGHLSIVINRFGDCVAHFLGATPDDAHSPAAPAALA